MYCRHGCKRPCPSTDAVTGDLQCGDADHSGVELVGLLSAFDLWLPSTFFCVP